MSTKTQRHIASSIVNKYLNKHRNYTEFVSKKKGNYSTLSPAQQVAKVSDPRTREESLILKVWRALKIFLLKDWLLVQGWRELIFCRTSKFRGNDEVLDVRSRPRRSPVSWILFFFFSIFRDKGSNCSTQRFSNHDCIHIYIHNIFNCGLLLFMKLI